MTDPTEAEARDALMSGQLEHDLSAWPSAITVQQRPPDTLVSQSVSTAGK